tara:strand:+ start:62 stop:430 length:369 start_codon:yes stop_codon:yes gene_type:complete
MKSNWKILVGIIIGVIITLIVIICIPVFILLFFNLSKEALDATHTMDRTINYSPSKKVEIQNTQQKINDNMVEIELIDSYTYKYQERIIKIKEVLKQDSLIEKKLREEFFLSPKDEILFIAY